MRVSVYVCVCECVFAFVCAWYVFKTYHGALSGNSQAIVLVLDRKVCIAVTTYVHILDHAHTNVFQDCLAFFAHLR